MTPLAVAALALLWLGLGYVATKILARMEGVALSSYLVLVGPVMFAFALLIAFADSDFFEIQP